jgi:hypothetical protein
MSDEYVCLNCGVRLGDDQYGVCSDACDAELQAWVAEHEPPPDTPPRGPVSWCCICGGSGGRDGSRCWGCE